MHHRPEAGARAAAIACSIVVAALAAVGCSGSATPATSPAASTAESAAATSPSVRPAAPTPTVGPIGLACLESGEQAATVTFSSSSGVPLGGVILGRGRIGVVLAHEALGNLCEWMPYARHLAATGHTVLAFDLNGRGSSPASPGSPAKPRWDLDVEAAAAFLRERGVADVALVGSNVGGIASLVAAGQIQPPVAAVVVFSAQVEMSGLDGRAAAAAVKVPVLYIMSSSDEYLDDMRTLAGTTTAPHRVEVVDVIGHGADFVTDDINPDAAGLRDGIASFVDHPPSR
jgi:dienelactone hydrolase